MAAYSLIRPTIILLSGQSFERFILTLGLIALAVIFSLTAFIFIRILLNWLQDKLENNRRFAKPQFTRKTGNSTADILEPENVFLEPIFVETDGNLTAAIFGTKSGDIAEVLEAEIICEDAAVVAHFYKPIALWHGRLILPSNEQRQPYGSVFFEVINAPKQYQNFIGKTAFLKWSTNREVQFFVHAVSQDINFTKQTKKSQKSANIHPDRLNGWRNVGPLETLAGSRLEDSVTVMLRRPVIVINHSSSDRQELIIDREPVQIIGRWCALVSILQRKEPDSDKFIVRHFNKTSQQFDVATEIIRIPQVQPDKNGIARSTNHLIEQSPLNPDGWYIYGERDEDNIFVVQAIEPRKIAQLTADETHFGLKKCLAYLNSENWKNTPAQKGQAKIVLLSPNDAKNAAISPWQEGDIGIVIHCFGGIGGKGGESAPLGIVTGHFAFGVAKVVRDRFTSELRFDIEYKQVYAHNPDGIVAGSSKWQSYMGDLQRGWLGDRPVCDIICKLDCVCCDYDFDGIILSPLTELNQQLDIMMARYRSGDGTGATLVTPATSCVQDSSQAIYATIKKITSEIESNPQIQDWLKINPSDAQTQRFQQLLALGQSLEKVLIPLGVVRPDWRKNSRLAGIDSELKKSFFAGIANLIKAAISYRTMLPRRTQDEIAKVLLKQGAFLWIIRTNQVGGFDPNIKPIAPTGF